MSRRFRAWPSIVIALSVGATPVQGGVSSSQTSPTTPSAAPVPLSPHGVPLDTTHEAKAVKPVTVPERYRVRTGDSLELLFPFVPSFNQTMTVQPDGFINLRVVGDLHVAGQSVPELAQVLRERYAVILRDPVINVELRDFEKPYFVAAGEVERPGKYDLRGDTTLMQALAVAGGFKERAKKTHVVVFRRGPGGPEAVQVQEIDAKRVLEGKQLVDDARLEPGDLIFVSRTHVPNMATFTNTVLPNLGWLAYIFASRR
jgi:polysaccharide export outer membrane protein